MTPTNEKYLNAAFLGLIMGNDAIDEKSALWNLKKAAFERGADAIINCHLLTKSGPARIPVLAVGPIIINVNNYRFQGEAIKFMN
jgi:hypothetical protein